MVEYTEAELVQLYIKFFQKREGSPYYAMLLEVAQSYPDKRSIYVDYKHISRFDYEMADYLLENPQNSIFSAEKAMDSVLPVDLQGRYIHFRPFNLPFSKDPDVPQITRINIGEIRGNHMGKLVSIEGVIRRLGEIRPKIILATFQCVRCGALIRQSQQEGQVIKEPIECDRDQGGCGKGGNQTSFRILTDPSMFTGDQGFNIDPARLSSFVDERKGLICEPSDLVNEQPEKLEIVLQDDLVRDTKSSERVIFNGIVKTRFVEKNNRKLTTFQIYLFVVSIDKANEYLQIAKQDETKIKKFAAREDLHQSLVSLFAPHIFGYFDEKLGLLLVLCGGVRRKRKNGSFRRGDIHCLLCGDPGTGKSELAIESYRLAEKGVFTDGPGTSGVGATAAVVKVDDGGPNPFAAEPGALALADNGVAVIDEVDKMGKDDRGRMNTGMEMQEVHVSKAGVMATFYTRTTVIATANPKFGRWHGGAVTEELNIDPTMLTRFGLIMVFRDDTSESQSTMIAKTMIEDSMDEDEFITKKEAKNRETFDFEFLRKYIKYARRLRPKFSCKKTRRLITQKMVDARTADTSNDSKGEKLKLSTRLMVDIIRMCEAAARLRLSEVIEERDVELATKLFKIFASRTYGTEGGNFDPDILEVGKSKLVQMAMVTIMEYCEKTNDAYMDRPIQIGPVVEHCKAKHMRTEDIGKAFAYLYRERRLIDLGDGTMFMGKWG